MNKHGEVKAKADGTCTITATLADGRMSADVTVRVGAFTIPVYVTGNLQGLTEGEEIGLADIAALKAGSEDSILVDAGGSLQGTARASLTGGMDMLSAFSAAGYDLHAMALTDLLRHDPPGQRCQHGQRPVAGVQPAEQRGHRCVLPLHKLEPQPRDQWPVHRRGARGV